MKIRSMQTCIMSSLPHCIFRCSVFRYVTLVSFVFLFKLCYLIVTLLLWWRINTYLLTYLGSKEEEREWRDVIKLGSKLGDREDIKRRKELVTIALANNDIIGKKKWKTKLTTRIKL